MFLRYARQIAEKDNMDLSEITHVDNPLKIEGRNMTMIITLIKSKN